jgi:Protein of unknown function (DUF998)
MNSPSTRREVSLGEDQRSASRAGTFALLTILGIFLYVAIDVIAQILSPYNPIRQAESDLAVGYPFSWLMTLNFVIRGLLSFALITGLIASASFTRPPRLGLVFLGIWAAGALLLALFPTDLPGKPVTAHGAIHLIVALVAFISVVVGEILISRQFAVARPALSLAILTLIACALTFLGAVTPGLRHVPGLSERVFLGLALLWMLVVAFRLRALPASV